MVDFLVNTAAVLTAFLIVVLIGGPIVAAGHFLSQRRWISAIACLIASLLALSLLVTLLENYA